MRVFGVIGAAGTLVADFDSRSMKNSSSESTVQSRGTEHLGNFMAACAKAGMLNASGSSSRETILLAGQDLISRSCRNPSSEKSRVAGTSTNVCFTVTFMGSISIHEEDMFKWGVLAKRKSQARSRAQLFEA